MKQTILTLSSFLMFNILIASISCNGQVKSASRKVHDLETTMWGLGQQKLIKTQGSNEYQNITCGIQDRNGNLWFGTAGEGVYKYDGKLFTQYTQNDGLNSNHVWSILEDKDANIWFGTTDGICRFDGKNIVAMPISFLLRPAINNNSYYNEWSTKNTVWSMLQDKSGKIWFGAGDGVYCYDGKHFSRFLANDNIINKDSLQLKLVSSMIEDDLGNLWFASGMPPGYEGFCRYDGKMLERFKPKNEGWIRKVIKSKDGNLLLATRHFGVWSYDGKSFSDYEQPVDLVKQSLNYIIEDHAGHLWVASDYGKEMGDTLGGLWRSNLPMDKKGQRTFTKITNKEVNFILEDKANNIWFSARGMGLYRFDGESTVCFSE